ncbi:MAG: hypothetical protein GF393_12270 [Armatimonadia bacterium]|nr:hypothetical protein [Armatimonadia bacterium]
MLRYAGIGALTAIAVALIVHIVLTGFARMATDGHQAVPSGLGERLELAIGGVAQLVGRLGAFFVRYGGTMLTIVGIMLVGALAGIGAYMFQRDRGNHHTSRTSRRVRRKRRK